MPAMLFLIILTIILLLVVLLAICKNRTATAEKIQDASADGVSGKWQEGNVHYNGKIYQYNTSIKTYLIMGIDRDGPVTKAENSISGGQSDGMFLLVCDKSKQKMSVIAINRNTMTDVQVYDKEGNLRGTYQRQICLQHAYGDGMRVSCQRSVDTVSNLFYDIPISGYLSLNMDGISLMNDAVGGVTLEILQDMSYSNGNIDLKEGETVTLNGEEAYVYLRGRDTNVFASANKRLERQVQYIGAFLGQTRETVGDSETELLRIYNTLEDYLVSNVDFVKLAGQLLKYELDESNIYTLAGETSMGAKYEEFNVDEDALYELILEIFYNEVG
jgi:LCP family protein required for cell wall assembly